MKQAKMDKEGAKKQILDTIRNSGFSPDVFIRLGEMANKAIKNKEFYPMVVDAAIKSGIAQPGDLGGQIDYRNLAVMVALGNAAKELAGQQGMPQ